MFVTLLVFWDTFRLRENSEISIETEEIVEKQIIRCFCFYWTQ